MAKIDPTAADQEPEAPPLHSYLGVIVIFRLNSEDMPAIVTKDHGERVLSLTCFPCGQPALVRNHITPARLPYQENTWRSRELPEPPR